MLRVSMRVLLLGGTGFMGPHVARDLLVQGHEVAVFHRGKSEPDSFEGVTHMHGDRHDLAASTQDFRDYAPEVVVDFILASERQAITTMDVFRGIASRVVALSSGDVYRAIAIMYGFDKGLQPVPLIEESDLRMHKPYNAERLYQLREVFSWLADDYDKIPVERVVLGDRELAGTVLRLPMVYGPGDRLHRLHPLIKRIDDGRPAILIQEDAAQWRGPRGYVENVAAGIALAAVSPQAAGRTYNIAEPEAFSEIEWAQKIGRVAGWNGSVVAMAKEHTPEHLRFPYDAAQHWTMSSARIRAELGYSEPVAAETALERTIAWERSNPPAEIDPKVFDYAAEDAALAARASA